MNRSEKPRQPRRGFLRLWRVRLDHARRSAPSRRTADRQPVLRSPAIAADNAAMEAEPQIISELPKRKRRWYQFSLRTLLIGVTLCAAVAGMWRAFGPPIDIHPAETWDGTYRPVVEANAPWGTVLLFTALTVITIRIAGRRETHS